MKILPIWWAFRFSKWQSKQKRYLQIILKIRSVLMEMRTPSKNWSSSLIFKILSYIWLICRQISMDGVPLQYSIYLLFIVRSALYILLLILKLFVRQPLFYFSDFIFKRKRRHSAPEYYKYSTHYLTQWFFILTIIFAPNNVSIRINIWNIVFFCSVDEIPWIGRVLILAFELFIKQFVYYFDFGY